MQENEFIPGENESIGMVRKNRECHPGGEQYTLMNREEAKRLLEMAAMGKETFLLQLGNVIAPVVAGTMWIVAAAEGLCDGALAIISAVVCTAWAFCNYKWGNVRA